MRAVGAGLIINEQIRHKSVLAGRLRQALQEIFADPHYLEKAKETQRLLRGTGGFRQAANEIQAYLRGYSAASIQ